MALVTSKYIWRNGELIPWEQATTHILTHALHYGTAVFEGIRCYKTDTGSAVFRLVEHMERLVRSASFIMMDLPYSARELSDATAELIRANELESCYVRPLAYRGYGSMGVNPRPAPIDVAIAVWPWNAYLGEEALEQGMHAGISSWRQRTANSTPGVVKSSASYLNSGLAHIEALDHGYGEAILLNENGTVAEGSGENIFVVRNGALKTPPVSDGILEGITRDSVMQLARHFGYEVSEASLVRTDLYGADEVFFTGTAAEVTPIARIDYRTIGSGKRGPITEKLQTAFFDVVAGRVPEFESWLYRV
ncbi:MAG: branched-chain amino acid transaminase [Coriobacteriia bacterium]|nr:branched-chain amino acid transaminase [Coriobacteriia bacterium]MCL2750645.1 branched-chain amino acid transaminase [Coriobacteriia bacterium]